MKKVGRLFAAAARRLLLFASFAASVACSSEPSVDDQAITVGLLLPFTGSESATASNFERAVLFARDQVNAAGGVKGRQLRVVSANTHSDVERARQSVAELVNDGAVLVIGPESAEIAAAIKPILDERDVVFLSPLVGASDDEAVDCSTPWFRLAPSASVLGEALAKLAISEGSKRAAVLHSDGEYDLALRAAFRQRFEALSGEVAFEDTLPRGAQSYASTLEAALGADVESILLAASPRSGALSVNELGVLTPHRPRWLLSPLLKTDLLLQNVAPEVLEGAVGVTPKIYDNSPGFPAAFAQRWDGDQPLEGAFFYFDALALAAFALEKTELVDGRVDARNLRDAIYAVTGLPGEPGRWNEIAVSLERLRNADLIYYTGLTGPLLLKPCGDRLIGTSSRWQVHDGAIVVEKQ